MKELQSNISLREKSEHPEGMVQVKVAMATCGIASGAKDVMDFDFKHGKAKY
jgi:NADP-reducing hydrogenase subunit HndB